MQYYNMDAFLKKEIIDRLIEDSSDRGIRKTDELDGLECYCSDNPSDKFIFIDEFESKIRGYIFDNNKLVLKSVVYATEYNSEDIDFKNYKISVMREGTSIRIFYHKNKWYITTHRKINAYKSKWGTDSFGELFDNNLKLKTNLSTLEFLDTLDKNLSYVFLIGTSEVTRIVSPQNDNINLLLCMNKNHEICDFPENLKDWKIKKLNFKNISEIYEYTNKMTYPFNNGYGIFLFSENKSYKITNKIYSSYAKLRNNCPSILFAYLHNVFEPDLKQLFLTTYPKFKEDFDFYDKEIILISKDIMKKYFRKFCYKEEFTVSKQEHNVLYHIHGIFLQKNTNKINTDVIPITINDVIQVFSTLPPSNLNRIIQERKLNRKKILMNTEIK